MRIVVTAIICLLALIPVLAEAQDERPSYRLGLSYGVGNVSVSESPHFTFNHSLGFVVGLDGKRLLLSFSLVPLKNYSDSSASGNFGFFGSKDKADLLFSSVRAGFDVDCKLKTGGAIRPFIGGGLGYLIWKVKDPVADTIMRTEDDKGNPIDFSSAEMYLSAAIGLEMRASSRLVLSARTSMDFLTGVGASFSDSVNDIRGRKITRATLTLSYMFGGGRRRVPLPPVWPSSEAWKQEDGAEAAKAKPAEQDSDGDGINDRYDECANTPKGAYVNNNGCPTDSDGDGILDGLDDCPKTPRAAIGFVDIFGCPIDSDYDGVPDYMDDCKDGPEGAHVDKAGCPIDSDGDGVFDGLDDCPNTQPGVDVDSRGCIDIGFLRKPIVVNVDYEPGSFEIDFRTKERLGPLIKKLKILSDVTFTIYGYTDNVGPAEANQEVSQKRANRMRDWLITQGIGAERMTAVGRGETNFVGTNQTADGRAKNRRLELVFVR